MRILLMTQNDDQFLEAAVPLRRAGHEVVGCHESGSLGGRWPCAAVESCCPLDEGVDAGVILSRNERRPDEGVSCVIRHRVPLVVGGPSPVSLMLHADEVIDDVDESLADVVEAVVAAPNALLSMTATDAVSGLAERAGIDGDVHADVYRRGRDIDVVVRGLPAGDRANQRRLGNAAFAAVRDAVPRAAIDCINVGASTR